ncbi:uncharacterized protein ACO6RY_18896 [Pungitius sinensis]
MKLGERNVASLILTENIEMELFSSGEPCMETSTKETEEEQSYDQKHLDNPLVPKCGEEPEPAVQTAPPGNQAEPKTEPCSPFVEEIQIEMEVFSPLQHCATERMAIKPGDTSIMALPFPNKARCLKWRRLTPWKTGLVVKDVVCLPRGHYLAQQERHTVPRGREKAALAAMGLTARISIDYEWSTNQMESRLAMLFRGRFVKRAGQRFSFTFLRCVMGSGLLFVPDPPAEGWTGEQVLRISGHGALYILSQQDYPQSNWEEFVPVMRSSQPPPLTLEEFKQLFIVCYSRPDSRLKAAEEATVGHWEAVLTLVSDGKANFSFEDLLAFISGADHLPRLGFSTMISLRFYSQDARMSGVRLPYASTCALELFLPRSAAGPVDLLALLSRALHEALGSTHFPTEGDGERGSIGVVTSL